MQRIYDLEVVQGRMFTDSEAVRALNICLVGSDVVEQLLPYGDPVGQEVRLDNQVYQIIGVGKKQGSVLGQSRDNWVLIPLQTFMRVYGSRQSLRIWVKANGTENMPPAMDEARLIMRARRHNLVNEKDDFALETNDTFIGLWRDFSQTFFIVVIAVASIALVVGGIVIMNIMLVSVSERTREIGLRKSVGARSQDILVQFLIESSTIAAVGGLWGVLFGIGLAKGITFFTDFPSRVVWWAVVAGLLMAASVGLFFGIYPASRAARLDPVVALRAE
jgi:putative ABC transport system permease protein